MKKFHHLSNRIANRICDLLGGDTAAGILLILAAFAVILIANSPLAHDYHALLHDPLAWTPVAKLKNLHLWINDALMAIFFFVVGLEIKREVLDGQLSSAEKRRLPIIAAIAGMATPAAVYLAIAGTALPLQHGWAIPAATDIAFAVGVLGLLGKRIPASLRLFLLTVAIVDDLGAVAIIAVFYTASIKFGWLIAALVVLGALIALNRSRYERRWAYLLLAVMLWYCILHSGVHATIAGVLAAFTIPLRIDSHGDSMLLRLEHALVPWNAYLVVPVFALANAGVSLAGSGLDGLTDTLPLAVAAGLVIGKQVGIFAAIVLADRLGIAQRPQGASWFQLWGLSVLCGIGFTMSLFIGALAFPLHAQQVEEAKLGVLAGSFVSALLPAEADGTGGTGPGSYRDCRLPTADIGHAGPGLPGFEPAVLQQLDGNAVGRAHEGHMAIAWRAIDRNACIHQPLARRVDIIDVIGEMTEIAPTGIFLGIPVVGEFDFGNAFLPRRGQEDQREAALFIGKATHFLHPEQLEEADRRFRVADPDHGVQIFDHAASTPIVDRMARFIAHTESRV